MGEREGEAGHGAVGEEERVGGVVGYSVGEGDRLDCGFHWWYDGLMDGGKKEVNCRGDRERTGMG